jgi:hypothetical protein
MASMRLIKKLSQAQYETVDEWTSARGIEINTPVIKRGKDGKIRVFCDFESRIPRLVCKFRHEMVVGLDGRIFHQHCKVLEGRV